MTTLEIENRIASLTFDVLAGDRTSAASFFVGCGPVSQVRGTVVDGAGVHR